MKAGILPLERGYASGDGILADRRYKKTYMKHLLTITDKDITGSSILSAAEPRIAVNAVLFDADGNIALSYMGKYDLHTLPGGGVDPGEDLHAAVKREILEETGCDCEITGELGQISENRSEHDFTQERHYYLARVVGEKGDLHLTDEEINENTTVVWYPLEQALKIISEKQHDNYQRKFIQKRDIAALTEALMWLYTHDVPGYDKFIKIEPVFKGQSSDKKYYIETADGQRMLLRVSDIKEHDSKKSAYGMMERVYELGIIAPKPFGFGLCDSGKSVYSLSGWLDGEDADKALPFMSETEQYVFGLKAGETLRKIHSLPAPKSSPEWGVRFFGVMDDRLDAFQNSEISLENDRVVLDYLKNNRHLLKDRPQCFRHGDYSIGNLMITTSNDIAVIDWEADDFDNCGDPWLDFTDVIWSADKSPHFATGVIKGYFGNEPSVEFWERVMFYVFTAILSSIQWVARTRKEAVENEIRLCKEALSWFDNMNSLVPSWYLKDFYIQWIDGVPYKLKSPFDFSFLNKYGKVFKVYDDQDSGNICFGVADGENKYFVKFAGAPTERACVSIDEAVDRIKSTVPIYRDLAHPILTRLINAEDIGGVPLAGTGFAMVFEWTDAECMGRQYPQSREKFMQMPLDTRLRVFDEILNFHAHVSKQGYVAIDFYDGCIMYDFNIDRTVLCDIEFYAKTPYKNPIGRMWGSSRFMSPEEFELGAVIDEITNVYTMGATAFAFFGNERDRCFEQWVLSKESFDVAKKAVNDDRDQRQQSIEQFITEWRVAK